MAPRPAFPDIDDRLAYHRTFHHNVSLAGAGAGSAGAQLDWSDSVEQAEPLPAPFRSVPMTSVPGYIRPRVKTVGHLDWEVRLRGPTGRSEDPPAAALQPPVPALHRKSHRPVWHRPPIWHRAAVTASTAPNATPNASTMRRLAGRVAARWRHALTRPAEVEVRAAETPLPWSEAREFGVKERGTPRAALLVLAQRNASLTPPPPPPLAPPPSAPPLQGVVPCVASLRGEWGELPHCARAPPVPPPRRRAPLQAGNARATWFEGEHAVTSLAYLTRVAKAPSHSPLPSQPLPSPRPAEEAEEGGEEADWRSAARAVPPVVEPIVPINGSSLASLAAEARQARIVPQRSLSGLLATGLAPGELGTSLDVTLAREPVPAVTVHNTPTAE